MKKDLTRRDFVKTGLATALVGAGCLSFGLKEALAQAKETGKPLLTPESLNKLFANGKANKVLAGEAIPDIKAFIRRRFTLTSQQNQVLDKFSMTDLTKLQDVLKPVSKHGGSIHVDFNEDGARANHVASAPFACKTDVKVTTPVGSAEVHVEVS